MVKQDNRDFLAKQYLLTPSPHTQLVKKFMARTFSPAQELARRYVVSWQDGTQKAFLNRFWESAQRGDAFHLVRDNTKRLIDAALGNDKKPGDDDGKPNK